MTTRTARTALLATLALAQQAETAWSETQPPAGPKLPADVAAYVKRLSECAHWSGEDGYDAARRREIAAAMKALRCDAVEADERRLRQRYGRDPAALRVLDRAGDADG